MRTYFQEVDDKIRLGERLQLSDIETLYLQASDLDLMRLATTAKQRFHSPEYASYLIMAIINYTNVCVAKCDYCAFYRLPHETGTYLLSFEEICKRIEALKGLGGQLV